MALSQLDEEAVLDHDAEIAGQGLAREAQMLCRPPLAEVEGPVAGVAVVAVGEAGAQQGDRFQI